MGLTTEFGQWSRGDVSDVTKVRHWNSIIDLFRKHVQQRPTQIAVSCGVKSLSYHELDQISSSLAEKLAAEGVGVGDSVVVLVRRDLNLVPILLGVLRIGACYVPVDIDTFSKDHILETIKTVQPKLVLSTDQGSTQYGDLTFDWQTSWSEEVHSAFSLPDKRVQPSDLAYIVFTSGTTSKAKGVMIPHSAISNYVQQGHKDAPFNMSATPKDTVLLLFSPAFDACTGVIFSTICNGAHLKVTNPEDLEVDLETCSMLPITPSLLKSVGSPDRYPGLEGIFLGGESPSNTLVEKWHSPSRRIWNCYGPTETTCASLIAEIRPGNPIVLGEPMRTSSVILLNANLQICDEGEICISGPGLAQGYFNDAELSAQKFIDHHGCRYYRTGDLARRDSRGLTFLGRHDALIKHRGFLINIELQVLPVLQDLPEIESAVAFKHGDTLVAFITPQRMDGFEVRDRLSKTCDSFLVPDTIIALDQLPVSRNGKVDAKQLRQMLDVKRIGLGVSKKPTSSEMEKLIEAIEKVLITPRDEIPEDASFWSLGGNSLSAMALVSELRTRGFSLPFGELLGNRTIRQLSMLLKSAKKRNEKPQDKSPGSWPMSNTQRRFIAGTIGDPSLNYLLITINIEHKTQESIASILKNAWRQVLSRHIIFRATFSLSNNTQSFHQDSSTLDWEEICVTETAFENSVSHARQMLTNMSEKADAADPPTVFRLVTIPNSRSTLIWLVHHARVDGWSVRNLLAELRSVIDGTLLPPAVQHFQTIIPQADVDPSTDETPASCERKENVQNMISDLPFKRRPGIRSWKDSKMVDLPTDISLHNLESSAHALKVSSSTLIYCAWSLLLMRYVNSSSVVLDTVLSGRNHATHGAEQVVGPMLHFTSFATDTSDHSTKLRWFSAVQKQLEFLGNLEQSTAQSTLRNTDRSKVHDSLVVLQYALPNLPHCHKLPCSWKIDVTQVTQSIWTLLVEENNGNIFPRLVYDSLAVSEDISKQALKHFSNILRYLMRPEDDAISSLLRTMMTTSEQSALTLYAPIAEHRYYGPTSLKEAFESIVDQYPDLIAIKSLDVSVSYAELDRLTNSIANQLAKRIAPGEVVAIFSDSSLQWLLAIMASVKVGAVYCPIEATLPAERIQSMITSCAAKIILCPRTRFNELNAQKPPCPVMLVDETLYRLTEDPTRLTTSTCLQDPVFLTFSSGTTGVQKIVRTRNLAILSYLSFPPARVHAGPGVRLAQNFSCGFDACAAEIFGALCFGATLILKDPTDLVANLREATNAIITPSYLSALHPHDFPKLNVIMVGGEAVSQTLVDNWSAGRVMYNGYGPSECSVACLVSKLSSGKPPTLGRVVPGMSVYILDSKQNPVPVGVPGELYISGVQVAAGYFSSTDADAARFGPDPFQKSHNMFRTGDLGRWTAEMEVEFLGRSDRQVKVRGYRINLEDIERVLMQSSPEIRQVAVVHTRRTLVAYISPVIKDLPKVRTFLADTIAPYSRPARIYMLPHLPQTQNQKTDYRALEGLYNEESDHAGPRTLPRDSLSQAIADVWREVLSVDTPLANGPFLESDFYALGGHSLAQITVSRELSRRLNRDIPLRIVMTSFTLSELADSIRKECYLKEVSRKPFLDFQRDHLPLNRSVSSQERQLLRYSMRSGSSAAFSCPLLLTITGGFDHQRLVQSLEAAVRSSRVLRSRYSFNGNLILRSVAADIEPVDVRFVTEFKNELLDPEVNKPFDLGKDQLIRLKLFITPSANTYLLLVAHHAVVDGTALQSFARILQTNYLDSLEVRTAESTLNQSATQDLALDYLDWAHWRGLLPPARHAVQGSFWVNYLQGARSVLPLDPLSITSIEGESTLTQIIPSQAALITKYCQRNAIGLQQLLTACVAFSLRSTLCQEARDIVLAIPYSDRTDPGTETLLGCFLDSVHVRIATTSEALSSPTSFLSEAKQSIESAVSNYIPCDDVLRAIGADQPLFDAMVSVYPLMDCFKCELPQCTTSIRKLRTKEAKFPIMFEIFEIITAPGESTIMVEMEWQKAIIQDDQARKIQEKLLQALDWVAGTTLSNATSS